MYYAGIGSRETPTDVLHTMQNIAYRMARKGYTLRSGGAQGADMAFEMGCVAADGPKEIYLPWRGFGNRNPEGDGYLVGVSPAALDMAAQFHPNWGACSSGARLLHARNCHQVLGSDLLTPVSRVICWTKNASGSGGTGQALRLARYHLIRIDDLGDPDLLNQYRAALVNEE